MRGQAGARGAQMADMSSPPPLCPRRRVHAADGLALGGEDTGRDQADERPPGMLGEHRQEVPALRPRRPDLEFGPAGLVVYFGFSTGGRGCGFSAASFLSLFFSTGGSGCGFRAASLFALYFSIGGRGCGLSALT